MNKLGGLAAGGGAFLLIASAWAAVRYPGRAPFATAALVGLAVAGLPRGLAHAKLLARRGWRRLRRRRGAGAADAAFVSSSAVEDPQRAFGAIIDAVRDDDGFDGVRREEFDGGEGLVVTHAGFHSSFVRLTRRGHLVVTGASMRTRRLVDLIETTRGLSLTDRANNPLRRPDPVRGAPRVFLGVVLFALVLTGVAVIAGGAYPADAYTHGERTVLVSIDARADVDPGTSRTDASLSKAAFIVTALEEEAVEVYWESEGVSTEVVNGHGRDSLRMSDDARALLAQARAGSLSEAQADRADRIEADLHDAEASVAEAITARLEDDNVSGDTARLRATRDELRAASETPVGG